MVQNNATATDRRSTDFKTEMATHFSEFEVDYRSEDWCTVVHDGDEAVVIADHRGYEYSEWAEESDLPRDEFDETMHGLARQLTDRNWSSDYPVVFDRLEDE